MQVLIIGGTVFIGRAIVERLVARGHEVTVLHRRATHDLGPAVRNVQADRGDHSALAAALRRERPEAVFDVAYDWKNDTTAQDVEAAARSCGDRLHRYVFISSVSVYGSGFDHVETDPLVGDDYPRPYAAHKAASERVLFRMHEESGFPVTTFRPPYVHGPHQGFYREQFFWDRLQDGRPIVLPDGGSALMQWVAVSDLAEVCARAIEVPAAAGQAFNIAHEPITQRGFVELLARMADIEPVLVPVPRSHIQALGGELFGERLYFGEGLDHPSMTERVEKVTRILGVVPARFETALRATFEWYRARPRRRSDYAWEDRLLASLR